MRRTPNHLRGLESALTAVEKACEGTEYSWFVRNDIPRESYYAQIYHSGEKSFLHHASTPAAALMHALMDFNLRIKK